MAAKKIPLLDIDIQGTHKFIKAFPESRTMFILPPTVGDLEKRLITRGTETPESLKTRIGNAKAEIAEGLNNASSLIGYRLINNDIEKV